MNETADRLQGSIAITVPDRDTALDASFDLPPNDDDGESGDSAGDGEAGIFEDVWSEAGTYEVTVSLADDSEVEGESEAGTSLTIDDHDEEMLAVVFGAEEFEAAIGFATGEEFTELRETGEG